MKIEILGKRIFFLEKNLSSYDLPGFADTKTNMSENWYYRCIVEGTN